MDLFPANPFFSIDLISSHLAFDPEMWMTIRPSKLPVLLH